MNRTGAIASTWLLCLQYVCFLYNHISNQQLDWKTPMLLLTGENSDICISLNFTFFEEVLFCRHSSTFPSDTTEEAGYFVGFGESVGDAMTF
jgi:hypothetical protein